MPPSSLLEPGFLEQSLASTSSNPSCPVPAEGCLEGDVVAKDHLGRYCGSTASSLGSSTSNSSCTSAASSRNNSPEPQPEAPPATLSRVKSLFTMPSTVSTAVSSSLSSSEGEESTSEKARSRLRSRSRDYPPMKLESSFALDVQAHLQQQQPQQTATAVVFDSELRRVLEPYLRQARLRREKCRRITTTLPASSSPNSSLHELSSVPQSIADSVGLPYTALRRERAFLFDEHTHPLHNLLAQALQVDDLSHLRCNHQNGPDSVLHPLQCPAQRHAFHAAYDHFVTSFCIPLLHSLAMTQNIFHSVSSSDQIAYRYQAFPTIRVALPGQGPILAPTCGSELGYSRGCLHFCIPLTSSSGSNDAVQYIESHPGREDWHPLHAKSFGLGYVYDGSRCLSFDLGNPSSTNTRISLHFAVLLYRDYYGTHMSHDAGLCPEALLEDALSVADPDFYDEAIIDLGQRHYHHPYHPSVPRWADAEMVSKKYGSRLLPPSPLLGPPFNTK